MTPLAVSALRQIILLAALTLLLGETHTGQSMNARSQGQQALSSYRLINQALAARQINDETAYKYRVFAAFGDSRLPAQFQGDDSGITEPPSVVLKAGMLLGTFSAQTRAEMAPFFMAPAAPGSWVELQRASGRDSFGQSSSEIADQAPSDDTGEYTESTSRASTNAIEWHTVLAARGRVKVWAQVHHAGDVAKAEAIAREVTSTMWPNLVPLIGQPKSDMGTPNSSGGPELDIFLVRPDVATQARLANRPGEWQGVAMYADPMKCKDVGFYLLVNSRHPLGSDTQIGMLQTVAHEIAHALTGAKPLQGDCEEYDWMREATATWAEHKAYPRAQSEAGNASGFLDDVSIPLPTNTEGGEFNAHAYDSYLFPLYLHLNNKEGAISSIWTQFSNHDLRSGIDAGLRAVGEKLEEIFPKFAAENLNPVTDGLYWRKDHQLNSRPTIADLHSVTLPPGTAVYERPIDLDIKYLATHYTRFEFDDSVKMITFENTLVPVPGAGVHAVEYILGSWQTPVDLTKQSSKVWCRDVPLQDMTVLVLVFTNNEWQNTSRTVKTSPTYQPMLRAYPDPCGRGWTGTHTMVNTMTSADPAMTIVETVSSTIRFDIDSSLIISGKPREYYKSVGGTITWRVEVTGSCTASANGSVQIQNLKDDHVASLRTWIEDGKRHHSGQNGPWPGDIPAYDITCPTGTTKMQLIGALGFFQTDADLDGVAADGKSFSGHFTNRTSPGISVSHSYSFRCSQRC